MEPLHQALDLVPGLGLLRRERLAGEAGVLGRKDVAIDLRQVGGLGIEPIDRDGLAAGPGREGRSTQRAGC